MDQVFYYNNYNTVFDLHGCCVDFSRRRGGRGIVVVIYALNDPLAHVDQALDLWTRALECDHAT